MPATPTGNSYLSVFQVCRKKWFWKNILNLQPKELEKTLETGSAVHIGLEEWEKSHLSELALDKAKAYLESSNMIQEWDITEACLKAYFLKFQNSPFQMVIPEFETSIKIGPWSYTMKIDGIGILDKHFYILEHKTSGMSPSIFFRKFQVDRQVSGYILGAQEHCPDKEIIGVFINGIFKPQRRKTGLTEAKIERELILRTPFQLEVFKSDTIAIFEELEEAKAHYVMNGSTSLFYQNTNACSDFNRVCEYMDLCKYGPKEEIIQALFFTGEGV